MAQDRMIRGEMRESEKVNAWPLPLRFFWTQLWGYCDDHGRGKYDARLIKAGTFPIDDEVTPEVVLRWMKGLETAGVVAVYQVDGKQYFECVGWAEHQAIRRPRRTVIPAPSGVVPGISKSFEILRKSSPEREVEGEREIEGGKRASAPPSEFCPDHPAGTRGACPACGDARRARKAWEASERARPSATPPRKGECKHRYVNGWCAECSEREGTAA